MRCLTLLLALWIPVAQAAPELNLVVMEGEGATNNIRQHSARAPVVQVEDENHKPVAGAIVVFTLPSNGAGGTFADGARTLSAISDSKGQAAAQSFRANGLKGEFKIHVNASFSDQSASTEINQTNVAPAASGAASGRSTKLIVILAVAGAAAAGAAYWATHNGNTSPTAPTAPTSGTTIAPGAGSVGPPR